MAGTRQQRWALDFIDPKLESDYLATWATEMRRQTRVTLGLCLVLWMACGPFDEISVGSPANGAAVSAIRFAVGAPLIGLSFLFAMFARAEVFTRRIQLVAVMTYVAAMGCFLVMGATLPEPDRVDPLAGMAGVVLTIVAGHVLLPVRFTTTSLITAVYIIAQTIVGAMGRGFDDRSLAALVWELSAGVLCGFSAYHLERARREVFLLRGKSDRLLRNVLPARIADLLKEREGRIAEYFPAATVLFGDLVGFTTLASRMPPAELVATLDEVFSEFDDIAGRHGLEKIKTIGDAYMVVGGVPSARPDHALAIAAMALEMQAAAAARKLPMRIGIHSGPVVAGVIGKQKFIYDLWGDTVNTASRMESHGAEGSVQITEATQQLLAGHFKTEPRGTIPIKGKGEMQTWLLLGRN